MQAVCRPGWIFWVNGTALGWVARGYQNPVISPPAVFVGTPVPCFLREMLLSGIHFCDRHPWIPA